MFRNEETRMVPGERIQLCFEMSESARERALADLRQIHPGWMEDQVWRELLRIWYGFEGPYPSNCAVPALYVRPNS